MLFSENCNFVAHMDVHFVVKLNKTFEMFAMSFHSCFCKHGFVITATLHVCTRTVIYMAALLRRAIRIEADKN